MILFRMKITTQNIDAWQTAFGFPSKVLNRGKYPSKKQKKKEEIYWVKENNYLWKLNRNNIKSSWTKYLMWNESCDLLNL